jgi:hypothetical protein
MTVSLLYPFTLSLSKGEEGPALSKVERMRVKRGIIDLR